MTAKSHRTKPRPAGGEKENPGPAIAPDSSTHITTDLTPDDVYIRIHVKAFRKLLADFDLRSADVFTLIALALRIDENNTCFPSSRRATTDKNYKAERWSREVVNRLEVKGVIQIHRSGNQSHYFTLPPCFSYGSGNRDSKLLHESAGGGRLKPALSDAVNQPTKNSHVQEQPVRREIQQFPSLNVSEDAARVSEALTRLGVNPKQALLLAIQYPHDLIQKVVSESNQPGIQNQGAWIAAMIQRLAGRKIVYSNSSDLVKRTAQIATHTGQPNHHDTATAQTAQSPTPPAAPPPPAPKSGQPDGTGRIPRPW